MGLYSFISMDGLLLVRSEYIMKSFSLSTVSWGSIPPISAKSFDHSFLSGSLPPSVCLLSHLQAENESKRKTMNWLFLFFSARWKNRSFMRLTAVWKLLKRIIYLTVCVYRSKCSSWISSHNLDASRRPITVTNGLWLFCRAAFRGVAWLNWTVDKQPTNPLNPAWTSFLISNVNTWNRKKNWAM